MASTDKAIYTIELNDRLTPGVKKAIASSMGLDKQMGKSRRSMGKSSKGLGALGGAFGRLAGPLALATAALKAFNVASESVTIAREFETLENAITFASGSAQEGAKNMAFLRGQAKTLGLPLKESAEGFKTLAASMMGSSLEGDPTREIFNSVSIAASAMGLSAEDAKGTFLALGQIMGKGKVQAEELRGQIGERIPGAFNIAAKAMGKSQAELNKMLDDGQLIAEDFLPKFAKELKKTFAGALPKAMNSSQAQLNRFNNMWLELKLKLGRILLPMVNKVMGWFSRLMDFLTRHKKFIYDNIISPLKEIFKIYQEAYAGLFSELTQGLNNSATAGDSFRVAVIGIGKGLKALIPIVKAVSKVFSFTFKLVVGAFKMQVNTILNIYKYLRATMALVTESVKLSFIGLKDVMQGAFTLDKKMIDKGVETMATAGKKAMKKFNDIMAVELNTGVALNALGEKISKAGQAAKPGAGKSTALDVAKKTKTTPIIGGGGTSDTKTTSTSVDDIKSGRPTHINIDIGKLVENMNITAQNVEDLQGQVKDMVAQALMSAVNNVNNIAGA